MDSHYRFEAPTHLPRLQATSCVRCRVTIQLTTLLLVVAAATTSTFAQSFDPSRGILLRGTVVTMDDARTVIDNGNVLVRNGLIVAIWSGSKPPKGTPIDNAITIDIGSKAVIFPGLINLHSHPTFNMLELWPPPSSHVEASFSRPLGTEPYANRYQWNQTGVTSPPELLRLVSNPAGLLNATNGLNLYPELGKYAEVKAMLGGETAFEGGPDDPTTNSILIRNVESTNFGRHKIEARVESISTLVGTELDSLLTRIHNGQVDAWIVHLAEGVRDSQRRPGDAFSSRSEFNTLIADGLLDDTTVIIHGNGLEPSDFAAMRTAPSIRLDDTGDGLGAKLVWSPLSNLLLYGQTALVYHAVAAGVVVSLGTDWSPSGSRNLLDELKVADITLRDPRLLGADRDLIPSLSISGKTDDEIKAAEIALDQLLVEMVTINPAKTLRWKQEVGSIEPGKAADLLLITKHAHPSAEELPDSPYRNLIDATEQDVQLVLVSGEPLAGEPTVMAQLKPGDYETVTSSAACFQKAIDVTNPMVPKGSETFASIQQLLHDGLNAMGGDHPTAGGGTTDNTYSYLKARIPGANTLTDRQFWLALAQNFNLTPDGRLNIEAIQLAPVLLEDDDFYFHLLGDEVSPTTGLIADSTPPFGLYLSNFNQLQSGGNPFTASAYRNRYFTFCSR